MPQALFEIGELHAMGDKQPLIFATRTCVDNVVTEVRLPARKVDGDMCISMAVLAMV